MNQSLSYEQLKHENAAFRGTAGVSQGNRDSGFLPAFFDTVSKIVHISCFANGVPAPIHVIEGVPDKWVKSRDAAGHVTALIGSVISGFIRNEQFYTREQVALLVSNKNLH